MQFSGDKNKQGLLHIDKIAIPHNTIKENRIENQDQLSEILHSLKISSRTSENHTIISIPNQLVITKQINTPKKLTYSQLDARVQSESNHLFPGLDKDLYLDYIQEESSDKDGKLLNNIIMVAARKQDIVPYVASFSHSGMPASIVDVDRYALARAFTLVTSQLESNDLSSYVALINIDTCSILINVIKDNNLVYCYSQHLNGSPFESAVNAKLGFIDPTPHQFSVEELHQLSVQVERALEFFFAEFIDCKLIKIILSGQLSIIDNIAKSIEDTTKIKTLIANPFINTQYADTPEKELIEATASIYMISAGLALRGI